MPLVDTAQGLIEEELLEVTLTEKNHPGSYLVEREYRLLSTGELVRRDAWVALKSASCEVTGKLGGQ